MSSSTFLNQAAFFGNYVYYVGSLMTDQNSVNPSPQSQSYVMKAPLTEGSDSFIETCRHLIIHYTPAAGVDLY